MLDSQKLRKMAFIFVVSLKMNRQVNILKLQLKGIKNTNKKNEKVKFD